MPSKVSEIKSNPFVSKLIDAGSTDRIVRLEGYVNVLDDTIQLFDDLSLGAYTEIRKSDIIDYTENAGSTPEMQRHQIFVSGSAQVRLVLTKISTAGDLPGSHKDVPPRGFARSPNTGDFEHSIEGQKYWWAGASAACRNYHNERISAINDWIDVVDGINQDGRFNGLISELR
ncbi:hypothetical protein GCM10023175_50490 [Pseudonocardia xishanensis]|uniref:Uncharacterized protein n=2 Tax=Pseudonocardia xishanensis TaxID=630995 RepID=A0ABP8RYT0_9PSEU